MPQILKCKIKTNFSFFGHTSLWFATPWALNKGRGMDTDIKEHLGREKNEESFKCWAAWSLWSQEAVLGGGCLFWKPVMFSTPSSPQFFPEKSSAEWRWGLLLQHKDVKRTGCWHPEGKNKTRGTFPPPHWKGIWGSESLLSVPLSAAEEEPWAALLGKQ